MAQRKSEKVDYDVFTVKDGVHARFPHAVADKDFRYDVVDFQRVRVGTLYLAVAISPKTKQVAIADKAYELRRK